MRKITTGFTLVELLIVIVVIAILAAISVVAYTGIQNRANNTTVEADISTIIKRWK
jgi:prepilin-type N-terminal cleavage/methylation domain-containing protein